MKPGYGKVSIPLSLAREIDALVGRKNRNAFVLGALERWLPILKEQRLREDEAASTNGSGQP